MTLLFSFFKYKLTFGDFREVNVSIKYVVSVSVLWRPGLLTWSLKFSPAVQVYYMTNFDDRNLSTVKHGGMQYIF
jgi:hypothetical protein